MNRSSSTMQSQTFPVEVKFYKHDSNNSTRTYLPRKTSIAKRLQTELLANRIVHKSLQPNKTKTIVGATEKTPAITITYYIPKPTSESSNQDPSRSQNTDNEKNVGANRNENRGSHFESRSVLDNYHDGLKEVYMERTGKEWRPLLACDDDLDWEWECDDEFVIEDSKEDD